MSARAAGRILPAALAAALWLLAAAAQPDSFHFVILGDRTGEAQPGVWEQAWREAAGEDPAFVVTAGDTIEGTDDRTAEAEWKQVRQGLAPYRKIPLYLTPGNHDVFSARSEQLFRQFSGHPPNYSFDYGEAHFAILDNSRSDEMPAEAMAFLEKDLEEHQKQPVKFIFSHRPSWLMAAAFGNNRFPLHQLARRFGVRYVIAGHVHQMLHVELDGVTYLSMASSGGHLRASMRYADGWFFAQTLATVRAGEVSFEIRELKPPHGQGRVTTPADWGILGLAAKSPLR